MRSGITTDDDLVSECRVCGKLGGCDQHVIQLNTRTEHQLTGKSKAQDYRKANFDFARELLPIEILKQLGGTFLDNARNTFSDKLSAVERMTVSIHETQKSDWCRSSAMMTAEVRKEMNLKKKNTTQIRKLPH